MQSELFCCCLLLAAAAAACFYFRSSTITSMEVDKDDLFSQFAELPGAERSSQSSGFVFVEETPDPLAYRSLVR